MAKVKRKALVAELRKVIEALEETGREGKKARDELANAKVRLMGKEGEITRIKGELANREKELEHAGNRAERYRWALSKAALWLNEEQSLALASGDTKRARVLERKAEALRKEMNDVWPHWSAEGAGKLGVEPILPTEPLPPVFKARAVERTVKGRKKPVAEHLGEQARRTADGWKNPEREVPLNEPTLKRHGMRTRTRTRIRGGVSVERAAE